MSLRDLAAPTKQLSPNRQYGISEYYPGFMLAALIILAHFSVSSAMSLPNSAGVIGIGAPPSSASRALILGSASSALISPLSLSTISAGVFFGAPIPNHWLASYPGMNSATVGVSGSTDNRVAEVTACARSLSLLTYSIDDVMAENVTCMRIAWLKANPDRAFQCAAGGTDSVAGFLFQRETGTRFQIVSYRGLAPALQDLLAGHIDLLFDQPGGALPQIRSGGIKAYAVTSKTRLAIAPDVPTVDEAGLAGLHIAPWHSLWVPKATPKAIIAKLNTAAVEALADPVVRKRLADIGQEIPPRDQQTPEALAAHPKAETERWWPIIKAAGIKAE